MINGVFTKKITMSAMARFSPAEPTFEKMKTLGLFGL
jgi:hypothetical protein